MLTQAEKDRVEEIRKREAGATPGPWVLDHFVNYPACGGIQYKYYVVSDQVPNKTFPNKPGIVLHVMTSVQSSEAKDKLTDWDFITGARSDVPFLLSLVDRLVGENEQPTIKEAARKLIETKGPEIDPRYIFCGDCGASLAGAMMANEIAEAQHRRTVEAVIDLVESSPFCHTDFYIAIRNLPRPKGEEKP